MLLDEERNNHTTTKDEMENQKLQLQDLKNSTEKFHEGKIVNEAIIRTLQYDNKELTDKIKYQKINLRNLLDGRLKDESKLAKIQNELIDLQNSKVPGDQETCADECSICYEQV